MSLDIFRRLFSFPVWLGSLLGLLAVSTVRGRFVDPDMWWHLKMGQVMWTTHTIPSTDIFSFTTNHHAYIPHEWLSQILIYSAYRFGAYSGLMLWLCCMTAAILIAGYILCSLYAGNTGTAFIGALTIWLFATIGFSIRPQMVGYLLLIIELLLLHLGRTRSARWFFLLPLLFAVWVNCHGSFFLGLTVGATVAFSSFFNFRLGFLVALPWEPARRKILLISLTASVLALFLNPAGLKLIRYPLETLLVPSIGVAAVSEWQPLQFGDARGLALLGVLICILLLVLVRRSDLHLHELLLLILATWLAASHRRLLFPFGILVAPIFARLLANSSGNFGPAKDRPVPNAILIAASLLIAFTSFPSSANLAAQVEQHTPIKAVAFIQSHHLPGPMLNDWDDGGYLIWAAPEYPDFIDGRADVFEPTGVTAEFSKWANLETPASALLDKYHINFCLLEQGSAVTSVLPQLPEWKIVYSDARSVVFVRVPPVTAPR